MLKRTIIVVLLLTVFVFMAAAQDDRVVISGDFQTIYTLGNADSTEQRLDVEPSTVGAFFHSDRDGSRRNGYYTAANLHALFRPTPWLEGYFRIYSVHRPGSFYMPLQMENMNRNDFSPTLDVLYGRASVFEALGLDLPVELFLKAGKFKAEASMYGVISKYRIERVLIMMNTKTDFTYELGVGFQNFSLSGAINYLFNQSVQAYFNVDGASRHDVQELNVYLPQFLVAFRGQELLDGALDFELLYGMSVSNIDSGHSAGGSVRFVLDINDTMSLPIGLSAAFHQRNIDLLGHAAIAEQLAWASVSSTGSLTTMSFRETFAAALGVGFRWRHDVVNLDFNVAGSFNLINHIYRDPLHIVKLSADTMVTFLGNYFVGCGIIIGSLLESQWVSKEDAPEDFDHTYNLAENLGFEVYAGINLGNRSNFVVGFNQNKGLSINNMLEARHEGQIKFKQIDTSWSTDSLLEAGGLYFKFQYRF